MRYLVDTCTFLFLANDPDLLGPDIQSIFEDYDNEFCISIESIKELIIAYRSKGVSFKSCKSISDIIHTIKNVYYFTILPLKEEQMQTYANLSINTAEDHRDPSDHIIIAHAICNRMPLISCDRKFQFYTKQGLNLIPYRRK